MNIPYIFDDIDPYCNNNFLIQLKNMECSYHPMEQYIGLLSSNHNFSVINYNLRSFNSNFESFFGNFKKQILPCVLTLSETRFTTVSKTEIKKNEGYHTLSWYIFRWNLNICWIKHNMVNVLCLSFDFAVKAFSLLRLSTSSCYRNYNLYNGHE